jgi:two-component system KDP operon response regulator KdpE
MSTPETNLKMNSKILLVDDDPTLLRFLQDFLLTEGFVVLTANSGQEALRLAFRDHPDLVVLDVMMPGMDGWEVCARLREMSEIPIIFLTAKTTEQDKLRGFQLGVDDYLTKPFSFAELTARIQAILSRTRRPAAQGSSHLLTFANIAIDLDKREARMDGQLVQLTPTEFRLMEYLVRNHGRAVTEEELTQQIWGDFQTGATTAVRRYIWLLRQKFEKEPASPRLIRTVRGYGYRLGGATGVLELPE